MTKRPALYVQPVAIDLAWNDPEENLRRMEDAIRGRLRRAAGTPSREQLFVFPELTLTGFVTKSPRSFALRPPDPVIGRIRELARRCRTGIVAGFPERNAADRKKPFNTIVLIDPSGGIEACYRKTHLFTVGRSPESRVYTPGDSGVVALYRGWKIGFAICFDIRFPRLFMEYGRAGAELILVPSCWIGGPHKSYQFRTLGSAQAILAQSYVVSVNRSGRDPSYEYDGSEYVFSPFGEDVYRDAPCRLDVSEASGARALRVRDADRPCYRVMAHRGSGRCPARGRNRPDRRGTFREGSIA
ncbi:MAG: carbon-nitrogen hydrolase family protein [Elusimicrobia bacterium]|nr:carbon-nitrogen hydrolase family protein [Elusimicrobiota bacterium]